jgi:hypothetical protein
MSTNSGLTPSCVFVSRSRASALAEQVFGIGVQAGTILNDYPDLIAEVRSLVQEGALLSSSLATGAARLSRACQGVPGFTKKDELKQWADRAYATDRVLGSFFRGVRSKVSPSASAMRYNTLRRRVGMALFLFMTPILLTPHLSSSGRMTSERLAGHDILGVINHGAMLNRGATAILQDKNGGFWLASFPRLYFTRNAWINGQPFRQPSGVGSHCLRLQLRFRPMIDIYGSAVVRRIS